MNNTQWKKFLEYFEAAFPNVAEKVDQAGPETISAWKRTLGACEFLDCKSAVDAMMDGKLDVPMQWSLVPAAIRRYADKLASARKEPERPLPPQRAYRSRHSMAAMLACITQCRKDGMTEDEALAVVNERFPIEPEDETPFNCLTCQDSGVVSVWANQSVEACDRGLPIKRYRATTICVCAAGDKIQLPADRLQDVPRSNLLPRYNHAEYCFYGRGEIERLQRWVDRKKGLRVAPETCEV